MRLTTTKKYPVDKPGIYFKDWSALGAPNLRAYWEFWAQNRVEGYTIFGTLSIPLGSASK